MAFRRIGVGRRRGASGRDEEESDRDQDSTRRGGGPSGGRGRDTARSKPKVKFETVFPRRELAYRLFCAGNALQAILIAADDTHKELAEQLLNQIATAREALEEQYKENEKDNVADKEKYKEDIKLVKVLSNVCQAMESALREARAVTKETPDAPDKADEDDIFASE